MRAPAAVCVALLSLASVRDSAVSVLSAQQKSPAPIETAAPDVLPITLTVQVSLSKLSPLAKTGSLKCYARVGTKSQMDFVMQGISGRTDPTFFDTGLASEGHYFGAEATVPFTITNAAYKGTHTVSIRVSAAAQKDQQTGKLYANPAVIAGCILYVNDMKSTVNADPQLANASTWRTWPRPGGSRWSRT